VDGTVLDALLATFESSDDPAARGAQRLSARDQDALEAAYRLHAAAVFRFALRCVGRRDLAEDLTSDAFLALQRNLGGVELGQLPSWLFRVVKNRAIDHWRRQKVERRYAERREAEPEPVVEDADPQPAVPASILASRSLKPVHRLCLTLRYLQGMTRSEIADRLGLSETQVKGHIQYARTLLRREIEGRIE
jgi:RNA polymerase sigma-70 factor (ECF subfamily)